MNEKGTGTRIIKDLDLGSAKAPGDTYEEKVVIWANSLFERAKRSRNKTRFDKLRKMYRGEHWDDVRMPSYRSKITDNRCFANVESVLPILVDKRPKAELVADNPQDVEAVKMLEDVYNTKWDDLRLDVLTVMAVKDSLIVGEGYLKVWWDHTLKNGLGDLGCTQVNPDNIYPDPDSRDPFANDAYYMCYHALEPLSLLKMRYPHKATQLDEAYMKQHYKMESGFQEAEDVDSMRGEHGRDEDDDVTYTSYSTVRGELLDGSEKMPLTEIWIDDRTMAEHYPDYIVDVTGAEPPQEWSEELEQQHIGGGMDYERINGKDLPKLGYAEGVKYYRKYPYGRIVTVCEKILLRDDPSPYHHGRSPYVRFFRYTVPGKNYFYGEIDQIIGLNKELNKRKSQVIDILQLVANPPMVVNQASGIDTEKIVNQPGLIISCMMDVDRAIKWLQPPNIPSALFVQMETINKDLDTVSGIHDVTQGRKPTGITAGIAIDTLQEAAQTRIRLGARFIEWSHKHLAELIISIIWQFYREERSIRKFNGTEWEYTSANFDKMEFAGDMPSVRIEPGSTMPINKAVLRQQAKELFQIGAMTRRSLLELFPGIDIEANIAALGDGNPFAQPQGGVPGAGQAG